MLQANPNNSVLTVSPPDSGFSPRSEFVRDSHVPSTFALLAIAGTSFVRLSSFSQQLIVALRAAFESQDLLHDIREEPKLNLIEFNLEGKPWAKRNNPESDRLFVQVLAIIFQHGYRFLSTIDYGREQSERVSIAFSRPSILSAYEAARIPFALSFPSSTVLRVINPPLNSTPAILAAARSAWPRGVVSERCVSNGCYEFRLKGYSWFQEDTFSSDSMQHILALLNALDRYAFTLLTSISLSGSHSRVKDLWIFAGSPMEPSSDPAASNSNIDLPRGLIPTGSKNGLAPIWTFTSQGSGQSVDTMHAKSGSLPGSLQGSSHTLGHVRSATEPTVSGPARSASVLRKKGPPSPLRSLPLGQAPFSRSSEEFPVRQHSSDVGSVDMTGIGSANQLYIVPARTHHDVRSPSPRDFPRSSTGSDPTPNHFDSQPERGRVKTGDLFYETGPVAEPLERPTSPPENISGNAKILCRSSGDSGSESRRSSRQLSARSSSEPLADVPESVSQRVTSDADTLTPPILGSRVFRDSAFSSSTSRSCEIPIAWTGSPDGEQGIDGDRFSSRCVPIERNTSSPETDEGYGGSMESGLAPAKRSSTPKFPGAWQPTPISEIPEDEGGLSMSEGQKLAAVPEHSPARKEVDAERVASPTLSDTPDAMRKSETVLYGMVSTPAEGKRRSSNVPSSPTKSDGWVLVSVADEVTDNRTSSSSGERAKSPSGALSSTDGRSKTSQPTGTSLSPIAKAIAVEDARSPGHNKFQSTSGLKRFFSGSRPKSRQIPPLSPTSQRDAAAKVRKLSLRERWRKKTST